MTKSEQNWLIGIGVITALTILYIATKRKDTSDGKKSDDNKSDDNQKKPDPELEKIIKSQNTKGIFIKSKVPFVKLRFNPYVNDGFINNKYGEITQENTIIGKVLDSPINDTTGNINPSTNVPFKWLQVKITNELYDDIQKNQRNFLTRDVFTNIPFKLFVREDTVKL